MLWTIVCLGVGWWVGNNMELVKKLYQEKVKPKLNSAGKATKVD